MGCIGSGLVVNDMGGVMMARPDQHRAEASDERPDPRVSLANERTLLAWTRTALALIAGGVAVVPLLGSDGPGARFLLGLPLIALGAVIGLVAHRDWRHREVAIVAGEHLPPSMLPWLLAVSIGVVAAAALLLASGMVS